MPIYNPNPTAVIVPVTLVVAASDSVNPTRADYQCDGVDDHVEMQAAIDALPVTGGEVKLLDGTYNCEVQIDLDSNQTLRGCGRNTILNTSIANLIFLSAVGGSGTEKTGIVITDMQIDGGAGAISDCGIYFAYVDYSLVQNVYSRRHNSGTGTHKNGICLTNSDFNQVVDNACQGNTVGIFLSTSCDNIVSSNTCQGNGAGIDLVITSDNNTISENICQGNSTEGIGLYTANNNTISSNICQGNSIEGIYVNANNNTITGNTCQGNYHGIELSSGSDNTIIGNICQGNIHIGIYLVTSDNNTVSGNTCQGNGDEGIFLNSSSHNNISSNTCIGNSQTTDNIKDNILLTSSDYNLVIGNLCRDGGGAKQPRYGINISNDASDRNCLIGNDLYDSGKTGDLNDVPTTNPTLKHDNRNLAGTGWLAEV